MAFAPGAPSPADSSLGNTRERDGGSGAGRLEKLKDSGNPGFKKFTEQNWKILDVLLDVSKSLHRSPAQVALNWVATQPGVTSTILGASKLSQLEDNLGALDFAIPADLREQLDRIGAPPSIHPYMFFEPFIQGMIHGGARVHGWNSNGRRESAPEQQTVGAER